MLNEEIKLSSSVTIRKYRKFEKNNNSEKIAEFIFNRFNERYILPLCLDPKKRNGFCIMAVCCLMIEAVISFYYG
jgi:hypothetical protein